MLPILVRYRSRLLFGLVMWVIAAIVGIIGAVDIIRLSHEPMPPAEVVARTIFPVSDIIQTQGLVDTPPVELGSYDQFEEFAKSAARYPTVVVSRLYGQFVVIEYLLLDRGYYFRETINPPWRWYYSLGDIEVKDDKIFIHPVADALKIFFICGSCILFSIYLSLIVVPWSTLIPELRAQWKHNASRA